MFSLTDTHCHLNYRLFEHDLDMVINRARQSNVKYILVPGIDLAACRLAVDLSDHYSDCYATVGIHPHDANTWDAVAENELRILAQHPKVKAIGEIGLDYYRNLTDPKRQNEVFITQLALAAEMGKPVIIHSRDADQDTWSRLCEWHDHLLTTNSPLALRPGVLHSYSGTLDRAFEAIERGFYIGVGGPVTFSNARTRQQIVSQLPLESILIETDAPFLAPHPHRGQRNEPAYVGLVAEKIANLKQLPVSLVAEITTRNASMLLGWGE